MGIHGNCVLGGAVLCDDMRAGGQLWFDSPAAAINWLRAHSHPLAHGLTGPLNRTSGQVTTHTLQHLVAVVEVPQHGLDVGLVGGPGHEGQAPELALHSLHGGGVDGAWWWAVVVVCHACSSGCNVA